MPGTAGATPAQADVVMFSGRFGTTCSLPAIPQPTSGPYSCRHEAHAVACGAAVAGGAATGWAKPACMVDLVRAHTRGHASHAAEGLALWTCDDGSGRGFVAYRAAPRDRVMHIPVTIAVVGSHITIDGAYVHLGTGRTVTVRGRFPAFCAWGTAAHGYHGTITTI